MADSSLLNRLEGLDARYEEIGTLITDPSVIADQKRYVKLTKEYKSLENLLNAANKYKKLLTDIEEFKFLIANESDAEMREMAKEELIFRSTSYSVQCIDMSRFFLTIQPISR